MADSPDPLEDDILPEDDFPLGDGTAGTTALVHCPYCGEPSELMLDPGGGTEQAYVEDCQVCCRPWEVRVRFVGGDAQVDVGTEDAPGY